MNQEPTGTTSAPFPSSSPQARRNVPIPQLVGELRELVITYVKQETLVPIQSLGRWVGFGLLGSLFLGFGVVFLGLSGLRALQTQTGETFTGNWSWVPYLIVVAALALGAALVWVLRSARNAERGAR
jgi:hypothetical protein